MTMRKTAFGVAAALLAATALTLGVGCGEVKKAGECSAAIDALNEGSNIKTDPNAKADDLSVEIKAMEDWDAKVAKVEITDAELKKKVEEYRGLMKSMADLMKKLNGISQSLEKISDPAQLEAKTKELDGYEKQVDELTKKESTLVDSINKYCNRS